VFARELVARLDHPALQLGDEREPEEMEELDMEF
jgi:hypothetical protein